MSKQSERVISLYSAGWCLSRIVFATYFRWRVFNPERVPKKGGALLLSNHASFLDPLLVGSGTHPPVYFLARKTLFDVPLFGRLIWAVHARPIDREGSPKKGLETTLGLLAEGKNVVLFPEGTRTPDGDVHPARRGTGFVILKSEVPIIPVRVFGTYEAFNRHHRFPRPRPIAVKYGKPMHFEAERVKVKQGTAKSSKLLYQEAAENVMETIARLGPYSD